jgi:hypothetical protein
MFEKNDRIIWDSGDGYEIGYFEEYCDERHGKKYKDHCTVQLICTENITGALVPTFQVSKYSDEKIDKLIEKYGTENRFSEVF